MPGINRNKNKIKKKDIAKEKINNVTIIYLYVCLLCSGA